MSEVIIFIGAARRDGHTRAAVDAAFGDTPATILDLGDFEIAPYQYGAPVADDFLRLADRMIAAPSIVFATPVYWYTMSAPMKSFFDRLTDLTGPQKDKGRALAGRRLFMMATGGSPDAPECFVVPFRETARYFGMEWVGDFYAEGPLGAHDLNRAAEFGAAVIAQAGRISEVSISA